MWYNAGTASVVNNSVDVTGALTLWVDNVDAGQAFIGPDGIPYEIASIVSATALKLRTPYRGPSAAGQAYTIMPAQGYLMALAKAAAALVQSFADVRDGIGQGVFPAGSVATPGFRFAGDENTGITQTGPGTFTIVVNNQVVANFNVNGFSPERMLLGDGAAAAPAVGFEGDDNTGLFREGDDKLGFATGGIKRVLIDDQGRVKIGAGTAEATLDVLGAGVAVGRFRSVLPALPSSMDGGEMFGLHLTAARANTTFSGSDNRLLTLGVNQSGSVYARAFRLDLNASDYLTLSPGASEKVRILANGNFGIGVSNVVGRLDAAQVSRVRWELSGSSVQELSTNAAANAYANKYSDALSHTFRTSGSDRVVIESNGELNSLTGVIRLRGNTGMIIQHDGSNSYIRPNNSGGSMYLGANNTNTWVLSNTGAFFPATDNVWSLGSASNRASTSFLGSAPVVTSDAEAKTKPDPIPDEWLDAWGAVEWVRYKFKDAVAEKGDGARWHTGLIAQQVRDAFIAHGLDATKIGSKNALLCYDEWDEEREPIFEERQVDTETVVIDRIATGVLDAEGNMRFREVTEDRPVMGMVDTGETRVTLPAGSRWGLRYDECQAMEAAWQRRELARKDAAIATLENSVAMMQDQIAALVASSSN
ncbi:MAG: tail fiber domain-containing protein [Novosphingobium sp.]|nr:tail fiber domain-containing protein [Novosphingobium sp.]